jgi:lysine 2,3-aminomutase
LTSEEDEPPASLNSVTLISSSAPEWKILLKDSDKALKEFTKRFNLSQEEINIVCKKYPVRANSYYLSLIKEKGDPIYKQCIPSLTELNDSFGEEDPLNEEPEHQVRKDVPSLLTHRYPDRVLFRISNQCAVYCRFCTRKRKVGDPCKRMTIQEINNALKYIEEHKEIRDVLLSGGDPLLLDDNYLDRVLKAVYRILKKRKNSIIRIGTRVPCVLPQRITHELCEILKKYHPLYLNTHFNHPNEITEQSTRACNMLANAGIVLGCQTVLLKGVNDNPLIMKELMLGLGSMRVRPYYIYQADPVKGTNHFRTNVKKGLEIYKSLRGHISGLCVPTFVIDAPGGGGKIPILPEYLVSIDDKKVVLRNYEDKFFEYPQVKEFTDFLE